jgi:hypothetical protein
MRDQIIMSEEIRDLRIRLQLLRDSFLTSRNTKSLTRSPPCLADHTAPRIHGTEEQGQTRGKGIPRELSGLVASLYRGVATGRSRLRLTKPTVLRTTSTGAATGDRSGCGVYQRQTEQGQRRRVQRLGANFLFTLIVVGLGTSTLTLVGYLLFMIYELVTGK